LFLENWPFATFRFEIHKFGHIISSVNLLSLCRCR
jgi:hypothetical protein